MLRTRMIAPSFLASGYFPLLSVKAISSRLPFSNEVPNLSKARVSFSIISIVKLTENAIQAYGIGKT